jgi:selenocysteine lyase/cysteine desulfurase
MTKCRQSESSIKLHCLILPQILTSTLHFASPLQIINIPEDVFGRLDMKVLENILKNLASKLKLRKRQTIGVFSAASNVTGALTDDVAVTALMHSYGGWAFWDYAAAAPHVKIAMNPTTDSKRLDHLAQKDALFFSGHKFLGGPQTTGI